MILVLEMYENLFKSSIFVLYKVTKKVIAVFVLLE